MKPKDKILTYEQARELRWFCKNCTGTRQEFYDLLDQFTSLKAKLDRLEKTCKLIEEFFDKNITEDPVFREPEFFEEDETTAQSCAEKGETNGY